MSLAESLGGVETLICHPATMTHASVPAERRQAIGLTDSLVRISAGIEDPDDLIDDLDAGASADAARSASDRASVARQCRTSSTTIGSRETKTIPIVTSEKLCFTTGTLPKRKPAPTQSTTHAAAPTKL